MTRSWRWVMAMSVFCSSSPTVWAEGAIPNKPGATQRVLRAYRKSYASEADRYLQDAKIGDHFSWKLREATAYTSTDLRWSEVLERMANAESRESLLAEHRAQVEKELLAEAQKNLQQPGALARLFGAKPAVATVDKTKLDAEIASFGHKLDAATKEIGELDAALAALPSYLQRGVRVGSPYGQVALKSREARAELLRRLAATQQTFSMRYSGGLLRMERALQSRITQQIKADLPARLEHYANAPDTELHAEAVQLIQDINETVSALHPRAETLHSGGSSDSSGSGVSVSRTQLGGGRDAIRSPFVRVTTSESSSHTDWKASGEQLAHGSDYTIDLSVATTPWVVQRHGDKVAAAAPPTLLPIEARLILEKVVRVSEIHLALKGRESPQAKRLADSLSGWVASSRFVVRVPEYASQASGQELVWKNDAVILASRVKADLAALGDSKPFIDGARAAMFKKEVDGRLVSELR